MAFWSILGRGTWTISLACVRSPPALGGKVNYLQQRSQTLSPVPTPVTAWSRTTPALAMLSASPGPKGIAAKSDNNFADIFATAFYLDWPQLTKAFLGVWWQISPESLESAFEELQACLLVTSRLKKCMSCTALAPQVCLPLSGSCIWNWFVFVALLYL